MRIAAVYCVYNEDEYIEYSIRSVYDAVDQVYVLLGEQPYSAYNANARAQFQTADRTEEIVRHPDVGQFIVKCDLFWRSFRYRIPADELAWMPRRIFKLTRWSELGKSHIPLPFPASFVGNNKTNSWGTVHHIEPSRAIFYHFSYARSPEKMREKLLTYSHAHEIPSGWYERVWLRWPEARDMTNLHPVDPPKFPRAVRCELSDLPEVMADHPYFNLDVIA